MPTPGIADDARGTTTTRAAAHSRTVISPMRQPQAYVPRI